jgi:hypothetical protein
VALSEFFVPLRLSGIFLLSHEGTKSLRFHEVFTTYINLYYSQFKLFINITKILLSNQYSETGSSIQDFNLLIKQYTHKEVKYFLW